MINDIYLVVWTIYLHNNNNNNNWADIVLRDKKEKTCLLISVAIPDDSNTNTKESEKLSKRKDLEI